MKDQEKHILVFEGSSIEVQKLKNDLQEVGIYAIVKDRTISALSAGFVDFSHNAIELWISETEIKKANPIIKQIKKRFKKIS